MNIDEYLDSVASTKTKKPKGSEQSQESQSHSQVHQEESAKERAHTLELSQSVKDLQKNWLTLVDAQITELDVVISTGNFSSALEHYTRLRTLWSDLTNMHSHLFTHLKSELISAKSKINDLYKRLEQDYIKHEHDILQLLSVLQDEIAQKNVETATKLYETVHKLFDEIPEEFSEKKSLLHSKIMYEHLQLQKIQIHHVHKTHNDFFSQYNMLLQKLATALKGQNVHVAKQTYVQCEELFKKFPQGYAHHKHQVYDYLVKARTKIVELERHGRVTVSTSQPTAAPHSQPAKASLSHKPVQQPHTTQPIKQSSPAKPASPLQKPVSQPSVAPPAKQPSSITPAPAKPASPLQKPVSQPSVAPPVKQPSSITPASAKPASPLQKPVSQPSVAPPVKQSSSVTPPPSKPLSQPIKPVAPLTPQPSFKKPIKTRETQSDDGSSHKLHELIQTKAPANHISSTLSQSRSTNPNISLDSKQFEPIKQPSQPAVEQKPPAPSPQPAPPIS
ncbi:MAG: hypothetical protein ACMXYF_05425, partial [Candidatus Woesearchaeota archaeon]